MSSMFSGCSSLTELDLRGFDTSKVTGMSSMFSGCSSLTELDLRGFDTSKVTGMSSMFSGCSSLTELDLRGFDTSKVTGMSSMFSGCSGLTELDLRGFDTSKVTSMKYMFSGCSGLTELDLSGFNTAKVTTMEAMFENCSALTDVDVSHFDTAKVTEMSSMFKNCSSLTWLDLGNWDVKGIYSSMYCKDFSSGTDSLVGITLSPSIDVELSFFKHEGWIEKDQAAMDDPPIIKNLYSYRNQNPPDGEITYYRKFSVRFDPNGGAIQSGSSETSDWWPGKPSFVLPEAVRKGADFLGWWTARRGGELLGDGPAARVYYAHWDEYPYTLILEANDGSYRTITATNNTTDRDEKYVGKLAYSEAYQLSETAFSRDNYIISGWSTRPDGGTVYNSNESVSRLTAEYDGIVRLYAQWASLDNIATIKYNVNGGLDQLEDRKVVLGTTVGSNANLLPILYRPGYRMIQWHLASADDEKNSEGIIEDPKGPIITSKTEIREDMLLVAEWKEDCTVTFNFNYDSAFYDEYSELNGLTAEVTVPYGTAVGDLPGDSYNGKFGALMGWYTMPDDGDKITAYKVITSDVDFYAHWGWQPKFNTNGGKFDGCNGYLPVQENNSIYTIDEFPKVVYDGHDFDYWYYIDSEGNEQQLKDGESVDLKVATEIIAHWSVREFISVTLNPSGGYLNNNLPTVYRIYSGKPIGALPAPIRTGHVFTGWYTDVDEGEKCTADKVFEEDVSLYAHWAQKSCKVTFESNTPEGAGNANIIRKTVNIVPGTTLDALPGFTLSGYVLEGWYSSDTEWNDETRLTTDTVINENTTYYAHWVPFLEHSTGDLYGYYLGVEWSNVSDSSVDNCGDHLNFHTTSSTMSAKLHITFELDVAHTQKRTLPAGALMIKIPKYVFQNWSGGFTGTNNLNRLLPQSPNGADSSYYFSYYEKDGCYYLVNNRPMDSGGIDITIDYSVPSLQVPGGAADGDGNYVFDNGLPKGTEGYQKYEYYINDNVNVEFSVDANPRDDEPAEKLVEKKLSLEVHTRLTPDASKSYNYYTYDWNKSWGEKPADAKDYFYVIWNLNNYVNGSQGTSAIHWSENGKHDGTIVYISNENSSNCTVVTKHPISLLEKLTSGKLYLNNEAVVTDTWMSGYETVKFANATAAISAVEIKEIEGFRKTSASTRTINGGQESILDDRLDISMPWSISYNGSTGVNATWDVDNETYNSQERTIRIVDGVSDSDLMYTSGASADCFAWEPEMGNIYLNDDDYYFTSLSFDLTEYDSIFRNGKWSKAYAHENKADYKAIRVYVRHMNSSKYVFFDSVDLTKSRTIALPAGTVGFEIRYDTSFYRTSLTVNAGMMLHCSNNIINLVQDDVARGVSSIIKNDANCYIYSSDNPNEPIAHMNMRMSSSSAAITSYELTVGKVHQYANKYADKPVYSFRNGGWDTAMTIVGRNDNTSGTRIIPLKSGEFYDLLPAGASVDPTTVSVTASRELAPEYYDIRFVDNWEGSGRTMMIISVAVPENIRTNQISANYNMHYSFEAYQRYGDSPSNSVAFVNTSQGRIRPERLIGGFETLDSDDRSYYQSLQERNEGFISYSKKSIFYQVEGATTWGFSKRVLTNSFDGYKDIGSTIPGGEYTYMLSYSQSALSKTHNLVLFDVLEQGSSVFDENGNATGYIGSEWHGELLDVHAVILNSDGDEINNCAYKVYYSTRDRSEFQFANVSDYRDYAPADLDDPDYWTDVMPTDKPVTAIAVAFTKATDGTPFKLEGKASVDVYIDMKAPEHEDELIGKTAYNSGIIYTQNAAISDDLLTALHSNAEVSLRELEPELHKASDIISGTKDAPTVVEFNQQINYTLSVTNNEDVFTMYDVVVEDDIPSGLYTLSNEIMVYIRDESQAISVELSPRVKMKREGQKLIFTVSSLLPGETIHLVIPTVVSVTNSTFENQAVLTSVGGREEIDLLSEITYHKVIPSGKAEIQLQKILNDRYELIRPGEFEFRAELCAIIDANGEYHGMDSLSEEQRQLLPKETVLTGSTTGSAGLVNIGPITFKGEGAMAYRYCYKITELIPVEDERDPRIKYSDEVYYAVIELKDSNETDAPENVLMVSDITYYKEIIKDDQKTYAPLESGIPTVTNDYILGGRAELEITKVIDGDNRNKQIAENEFKFQAELIRIDGKELSDSEVQHLVPTKHIYSGATTGNGGKVVFDPIFYDNHTFDPPVGEDESERPTARKYTYKITELIPEEDDRDPTITYSEEVIYADVDVRIVTNTDVAGEPITDMAAYISYYKLEDNVKVPLETPTVTNSYAAPRGSLTVSKTVAGIGINADTSKAFKFSVLLRDAEGNLLDDSTVSYTKTDATGAEVTGELRLIFGEVEFTLRHGEKITFTDLRSGTAYTVTELDANADGYYTSVTTGKKVGDEEISDNEQLKTGTVEGEIEDNTEHIVDYQNRIVAFPGVGGSGTGMFYLIGLLILLTSLGFVYSFYSKKHRTLLRK